MKTLPSKELLSEVLGINVLFYKKELDGEFDHCLKIHYRALEPKDENDGGILLLNIHELAHKCKEWAWRVGFSFFSGSMNGTKEKIAILTSLDVFMPKLTFTANTEPEAIFKACEWLMESEE